jgi:hypothetical protein
MDAKREAEIERQIEKVKRDLAALGDLRPGSLSTQYNVCGSPGCRCKATLLPLLVELRRKGYSLTMLTQLLGEKGIKISPTALSGYMAKLSGPIEEAPVRARREGPQSSTSASQTRGTFAMKPDTVL